MNEFCSVDASRATRKLSLNAGAGGGAVSTGGCAVADACAQRNLPVKEVLFPDMVTILFVWYRNCTTGARINRTFRNFSSPEVTRGGLLIITRYLDDSHRHVFVVGA